MTRPHEKFDAPLDWELPYLLGLRGYGKSSGLDPLEIKAGMDAFSFYLAGEDPLDALEQTEKAQEVGAVLMDFPIHTLSGDTPLDKGISLAAVMAAIREMSDKKSAAQQVKDALKQMKEQTESGDTPGSGEADYSQPEDRLLRDTTEEDRLFLAALANIRSLNTVKIGKSVSYEVDFDSTYTKDEWMTDLTSQFPFLTAADLADPFLVIKLAEMDFMLDVPYRLIEHQKLLWLCIDRSGSMHSPKMKQAYVRALLTYLSEGVKDGSCILLVSTFEEQIDGITVLDTYAKCEQYTKDYQCEGGGNTDVNGVIHEAHRMINVNRIPGYTLPKDMVPELVIINDGEDRVDPNDVPSRPTHAIILNTKNKNLDTLCQRSGGTYHYVPL